MLLVLSVQGVGNALRNTSDLQTPAQYLMTGAQFLYAALGPAVVLLRWTHLAGFGLALGAWALSFILAVGLIPWAWIAPSVSESLRFAAVGIACAAALAGAVRCGRRQ